VESSDQGLNLNHREDSLTLQYPDLRHELEGHSHPPYVESDQFRLSLDPPA
jgi:hypothetical protein